MDMWKHANYAPAQTQSAEIDQGLRSFMLNVYNYMAAGLALTGIVALTAFQSEAFMSLFYQLQVGEDGLTRIAGIKPLAYVLMFSPIAMILFLNFRIQSMSFKGAQIAFWAFAALVGLSLSYVFLAYTGTSVARVFFITAIMFGGMSLYGYTTKRDMTGWGSFLVMGAWGLFAAFMINFFFLQSTMFHYVLSGVGVVLFSAMTAYDTQRIKGTYYALQNSPEFMGKAAIMGALSLYLDFINLFIMLLQFFGDRR